MRRVIILAILLVAAAAFLSLPLARFIDAERDRERKAEVDRLIRVTGRAADDTEQLVDAINGFHLLRHTTSERSPWRSLRELFNPTASATDSRRDAAGDSQLADIAPSIRQRNYGPSCGWATTINLLRAQSLYGQANWIRSHCSGPSNSTLINRALREIGVPFMCTADGDERLLEWAIRTRRGCGLGWPAYHCTMLVGRENDRAIILDDNDVSHYSSLPWQEFLHRWRNNRPQGGWAWAIAGQDFSPPPLTPEEE